MEKDDEWIEVTWRGPAEILAPQKAPKRRKKVEAGIYTELDPARTSTWPDMGRRIELETTPGGLVEWSADYVHAFGIRSTLDRIYIPLLGVMIPVKNLVKWRYANE